MKSGALCVHCLGWLWYILGTIRVVARAWEPGEFLFFLSDKQRTILLTSRRPNFTKFEHNTLILPACKWIALFAADV